MTRGAQESLRSGEVAVGDELPEFSLPVTSTVIVAGAIASRDFMPAHHDAGFAKAQGAPDVVRGDGTTDRDQVVPDPTADPADEQGDRQREEADELAQK